MGTDENHDVSMKSGLEDRNNAVNEDGTFVINE